MRGTASQHRAGDHAIGARLQLTGTQLVQVGSQSSAQQTRTLNHRTGQRYDAFNRDTPGREQLADGDHVLITDAPDTLAGTHRIEEMDVGTSQACRVRTGE